MEENGMKSAYEIALEKMKSRGIDSSSEPALTPGQKEKINRITRECDAKIAEKEIMLQSKMKEVARGTDPAAARAEIMKLQSELSQAKTDLYAERSKKIEEVKKQK